MNTSTTIRNLLTIALVSVTFACEGRLSHYGNNGAAEEEGGDEGPSASDGVEPGAEHPDSSFDRRLSVGVGGIKRLTPLEYDNTLHFLLGDPYGTEISFGRRYLPSIVGDAFSNDFLVQEPSLTLVKRVEQAAVDVAEVSAGDLAESPAMQNYVFGCQPSGSDDEACFRTFIRTFGRRAIRRPLTEAEVDAFTTHFFHMQSLKAHDDADVSSEASDASFFLKARLAIHALLQHAEFLYRPETGEPANDRAQEGVVKLDDFSMASRLSYFLWGGPPDDALLDAAERGDLSTPQGVREEARRMLDDPRGRERMLHFHAAWLDVEEFWLDQMRWGIDEKLAASMREESRHLMNRVIFEQKGDWREIFLADETWVDGELAGLYEFVEADELEVPAGEEGAWVDYPADSKRGGILSHAMFLTNGRSQEAGKTNLIKRGNLVLSRLTCLDIHPGADMDPPEDATEPQTDCKYDWFQAKTLAGDCQNCHYMLNHAGVGLEQFDGDGRFREREPDTDSECRIRSEEGAFYDGDGGEWYPAKTFDGPGELGRVVVENEVYGQDVASCMVEHLYEYALGHEKRAADSESVAHLKERFAEVDYRFDALVLELVSSDAFRYRIDRDAPQ